MAITKRTRFEVLRRDAHTCRYCRSADRELTLDHVVPVALGGSDDPSNLVACCKDCNAGKTSTSPGEHLVAQVDEDALRWAAARARAVEKRAAAEDERTTRVAPFLDLWKVWDKEARHLPANWSESLNYWLDDGMRMQDIFRALDIAVTSTHIKSDQVFRYMAGIVRNWIADIDRLTREELDGEG